MGERMYVVYDGILKPDTVKDIRAALDKVGRSEEGEIKCSWIATFLDFAIAHPEG